jgi:serine/threonine-protein kinase
VNCPRCQAENDDAAPTCTGCGESLARTEGYVLAVDIRPGAIFHGRYEVQGLIGRGGMGMVYRARDRVLDEVVAIKILRPDFAQDPKMAERFRSEIKLARRVRHRNVCAIHDYGEDRGLLFISMEFVEGTDLKRLLRERGALDADLAYDLAVQVAEGLQAVHEAGIVHRDLKTPNIMLDARGHARLMDFGVAKRVGEGTLTEQGHIVGTPEYMSPEQARGEKVDSRSDLYALGVLTYEMFTGRVPFRGDTPISTIMKHLNDPPPVQGEPAARIPPPMRAVLGRALAKEPRDRYATAHDMAEAIRRARSPSARQHPVATDALVAPTVVGPPAAPARPRAPRSSPRRVLLQPWLLAVPVAAVAGFLALRGGMSRTPSVTLPAGIATPESTEAVPAPTSPPVAVPAAASAAPVPAAPFPSPSATPPSRPTPRSTPPVSRPAAPPSATVPAAPAPTVPPSTAPPGPGLLQVAVRPWGEVSVDGKVVGTTPLDRLTLPAGVHTIRLRHPSYEPQERTVTIRPGQLERLFVDLSGRPRRE